MKKELNSLGTKYGIPLHKYKDIVLPPIDTEFTIGQFTYRVSYINARNLRFSAEVVGIAPIVVRMLRFKGFVRKLRSLFRRK